MGKEKKDKGAIKKPFYKKWWFWVIVIIVLIGIIGNIGNKDNDTENTSPATTVETEATDDTQSKNNSEFDNINFVVGKVRNDVTGNWRISTIAENIEMQKFALDYYKTYFESDDEIHAIVNFNYNTTTKISVMGNLLDVTVYEYVDKEEHDAKLLFSGTLLKEYHVNMDNGEIEEVQ